MASGNTQNPAGAQPEGAVLQQSNHPTALMFHVGFKAAALFVYLFGGLFSKSFVVSFVMVVLLLAFDFWTVKNVSGRLLVGLRWWNEVREDGTNEWRFESREDTSRISDLDSRVFWLTLWVMPILWTIFTVSTFFSFNYGWMLCCLVGLSTCFCTNCRGRFLPESFLPALLVFPQCGHAQRSAGLLHLLYAGSSLMAATRARVRGIGASCLCCVLGLAVTVFVTWLRAVCRWLCRCPGQICMAIPGAATLPRRGSEASPPRWPRACSRSNCRASRAPTQRRPVRPPTPACPLVLQITSDAVARCLPARLAVLYLRPRLSSTWFSTSAREHRAPPPPLPSPHSFLLFGCGARPGAVGAGCEPQT
jgi:hypothetical protein